MCASAIRAGITHLAITDHYDVNAVAESIYPAPDLTGRAREIADAAEKYRGRIIISRGIELGSAIQYPKLACRLLDTGCFDTVIASVHYMRGHDDFCNWNMAALGEDDFKAMWLSYLDDMRDTVLFGRADILAHFTYPLRYLIMAGKHYDISFSDDRIAEILELAVNAGMLLEVNSSGYRQGLGAPLPDAHILKLYRKVGGRLISVGSDAHRPCDIAADFDKTAGFIAECGFDAVHFRAGGIITEEKINL